jgi:hypothetical protein
MNPTQPARYFEGLSTILDFQRDYETQATVPVDGSNSWLRTLSPFVIRALPPLIFSNTSDTLRVNQPSLSLNEAGTGDVAEARNPTSYRDALLGVNRVDPSASTYQSLLNTGRNIPGMGRTVRQIDEAYHNVVLSEAATSQYRRNSTTVFPSITNNTTGISILRQLRRLLDTPPLVLLINPSTFSVQHAKIAQFQERSRYGYIYQAWGEELIKLSISCRVGAFTTGKSNPSQTNVPSGVQFASKNDSAAFQQLMAMMTLFQSSAYIVDTVQNSRANYMVGNLAIEYDQNVYVGHMDSFSYSYDEMEQNGGMKFDIDFTAVRTYDVATPKSSINPLTNPNTNNRQLYPGGTQSRLSRTFRETNNQQQGVQFFTTPGIGTTTANIPDPWRSETAFVAYQQEQEVAATTGGSLIGSASRDFSTFDGQRVQVQVPPSSSINYSPVPPTGNPVYVASNQAYAEVPVFVEQTVYEAATNVAVPTTTLAPTSIYTASANIATTLTPVLTSRRGT